jgi:hypothetical protein
MLIFRAIVDLVNKKIMNLFDGIGFVLNESLDVSGRI